jgi:release factor glutamine methyltransferase
LLTINQALKKATKELSHLETPQKEARLLLSFFLDKDMIYLTLNENQKVDESFFELVKKRNQDIPIEYITKKVSFYSEEFFCDFGALIPRPETELLIDEVLKLPLPSSPKIAEIGVGSGIISIMIKKHIPSSTITATDISLDAIKVAKKNSKLHNTDIELIHTSYLDGVKKEFDVIVSNPPYIKNEEKLDKNLDYEPQNALFGGESGDEILKNIVDLAIMKRVKFLVCEMGYDQKEPMTEYFKKKGLTKYHFYKDFANFDRGFVVEFDRV